MPSSDASIGTLSAVTEVLSLVDKGQTTIGGVATQAAAPDNSCNHGVGGLTRIDLRQELRNPATRAIAIGFRVGPSDCGRSLWRILAMSSAPLSLGAKPASGYGMTPDAELTQWSRSRRWDALYLALAAAIRKMPVP